MEMFAKMILHIILYLVPYDMIDANSLITHSNLVS